LPPRNTKRGTRKKHKKNKSIDRRRGKGQVGLPLTIHQGKTTTHKTVTVRREGTNSKKGA